MRKISWSPPNLGSEEKTAVIRVLESGWLTQGEETKKFEEEIAKYIGCNYAIAVNNGTSALVAALLAHEIGKEDEVIVPSLTFVSTINAVIAVGATPVLCDSDLKTFNTTPEFMRDKITEKTKAIMPVDVAGMPVDLDGFKSLADDTDVILIEDAAEAMGAEYKGKKVGSFDHTSILSFHMAKLCTTIEGGCILTNNEEIAERCKQIRNVGMKERYNYTRFGLNLRITDVQAAIGRVQLKKADHHIKEKNKFARMYIEELKELVEFQKIPEYVTVHPWMLFGVLVESTKRGEYIDKLNKNGIETRICWPPLYLQQYHSRIFKNESYPNTEEIGSRIINLPMGNGLNEEDIKYIIDICKEIMG